MLEKLLVLIVPAIVLISSYFLYQFYMPKDEDEELTPPKIQTDYDIIVVGSGLAGLTAAFEANRISNNKCRILLLEKEARLGGNSKKASSGINIMNSPVQEQNNVKDSFDLFYKDTMKSGKFKSDPKLVSTLVNDSTSIYDYISGLKVDLSQLGILGGHSVARTHRPLNGTSGYVITSAVEKKVLTLENVTVYSDMTVIDLVYINSIEGVMVKNNTNGLIKMISSKAVILATGGFAHDYQLEKKDIKGDYSLLNEFAPHLMKLPTTNGKQARGLGLKMARKIGAQIIGMEEIQVHPTGFVDMTNRFARLKFLAAELIRGVGAILINQDGKRFCNELGTRDYVTNQIYKFCKKVENDKIDQYESFIVLSEEAVKKYGSNMNFYIKKGLIKKFANFKHFSEEYKLDINNLKNTIDDYNKNKNGTKDEFGKILFPTKFNFDENVYVGVIAPSLHYTMGGLKITKDGEVLNTKDEIIPGLYGAGEVTGGVHGGNRLGGNSLLECAVYGIRSARKAIEYVLTK